MDAPVIDPSLRDRESLLSADMGLDTHEEIKRWVPNFDAPRACHHQSRRRLRSRMFTAPEHRQAGCCRALLDTMHAEARAFGMSHCALVPSRMAWELSIMRSSAFVAQHDRSRRPRTVLAICR